MTTSLFMRAVKKVRKGTAKKASKAKKEARGKYPRPQIGDEVHLWANHLYPKGTYVVEKAFQMKVSGKLKDFVRLKGLPEIDFSWEVVKSNETNPKKLTFQTR